MLLGYVRGSWERCWGYVGETFGRLFGAMFGKYWGYVQVRFVARMCWETCRGCEWRFLGFGEMYKGCVAIRVRGVVACFGMS